MDDIIKSIDRKLAKCDRALEVTGEGCAICAPLAKDELCRFHKMYQCLVSLYVPPEELKGVDEAKLQELCKNEADFKNVEESVDTQHYKECAQDKLEMDRLHRNIFL